MGLDKHNLKYYGHPYKTKKEINKKMLIFSAFLLVMSIIVFTTLYSNGPITGNVITGKAISETDISDDSNKLIIIESELTIPSISFKGDYSEIKILSSSETTIYLGDQSLVLDDSKENQIILKEFSGKVQLGEDGILLDGKVLDVNLNGLPIKKRDDKKIEISSDSEIPYNSIEFKEDLFLKEINYLSSGVLFIGEYNPDKIILKEDSLIISNYLGKLKINEGVLFLKGLSENIEISGDGKTMIISS